MDGLIPIGQLSSTIGVSIRTIRYYEEVGILKPSKISENNYRYYGEEPIEKLKLIIFLKKMGFTLQEIKTILTEIKISSFEKMIREHQKQLDLKLQEILLKKEILDLVMSSINCSGDQVSPISTIIEVSKDKKEDIDLIMKDQLPIKVIGIGENSVKSVNKLIDSGAKMDFIHIDDNKQSLLKSKASRKIKVINTNLHGFEINTPSKLADQALQEEIRLLFEVIKDSEILFIVSDLDCGSSSTIALLVAQEARKIGVLTVGVMVYSSITMNIDTCILELRDTVDTLLDIPKESVHQVDLNVLSESETFSKQDDFIQNAVSCLSSLFLSDTVQLKDIKTLTEGQGIAYIGIGRATGENRAIHALDQALASPTLHKDISSASSVIVNITGSDDMSLPEVRTMLDKLTARLNSDVNVIFGAMIDEGLKDSVIVNIVASGFKIA
jgi:cell division protein FtsZ